MTKLYYDNPLKAAWMAREFGVRFRHMGKGALPLWIFGRWVENKWDKRAYIHPDSLHIFEPMEGDVITATHKRIAKIVAINEGYFGGEYYMVDRPYTKDERDSICCTDFIEIIQRNGKAFFMPESCDNSNRQACE